MVTVAAGHAACKAAGSRSEAGHLSRKAYFALICLCLVVPKGYTKEILEENPEQDEARVVTVTDAIRMTQLADPDYLGGVIAKRNPALFSPDGKHFVIVTRKGNIEKDTNDYALLSFQTDTALLSPAGEVLVSFSSSSNRPGIQNIKWIDNQTLAFLGENPGQLQQVYTVNCQTGRLTQLTSHSTSVTSYALNSSDGRLLFMAQRPVRSLVEGNAGQSGVVVSSQPLEDLLVGERRWESEAGLFADLFVKTKRNESGSLVKTESDLFSGGLWLSPNAQHLVVITSVPEIPESWRNYKDRSVQWESRVQAKPLHGDSPLVPRYELIDIETGQSKPLLDAPIGDGCSEVLWLPDSKSVLVSGVYLPLNVADIAERRLRQSTKMVAEIRIPSLEVVPITARELCRLSWDATRRTLVIGATAQSPGAASREVVGFQKTATGWKQVGLREGARGQNNRIDVTLEEDMNTPPRVFVKDLRTGRRSMLLDFNPQFKSLKFGRVKSISFKATDGHTVNAGEYLPPNYVEGKRYPLVIQTHAWRSERFWIDGPWPSAFAAQPLAGKGFVVLQLSEDISNLSTTEEAPEEVSAYEGAIDYLDGLGIVDRDRVGLIGFSRTGLGVEYALTHSKYHFAAATIADGSDGGYFFYLSILSSFSWRWSDPENINGGAPFGDGLSSWLKKSPGFNLTAVTTPVREESYHPMSLFSAWEWFAGLSRLGKPVELIYIPDADHVLVRPRDRMTSQEGNVDWFGFWLQGYEDPSTAKQAQYRRWRELRNLQQAQDVERAKTSSAGAAAH